MKLVLSSVHRDWCVKESIEMNTLQKDQKSSLNYCQDPGNGWYQEIRLDNQIYIPFTERGDTKVEQCSMQVSVNLTPFVYLLDKNGDFK